MKSTRTAIPLGVAAITMFICLQALAQFGSGGMGEGRHRRPGEGAESTRNKEGLATPADRARLLSDRLLELRLRLMITPEQATTWERFQSATQNWAAEVNKGRMASVEQTAPQAMQARLSQAQNRYSLMESLNDSFKQLYAVLTPEQQRLADQNLPAVIP